MGSKRDLQNQQYGSLYFVKHTTQAVYSSEKGAGDESSTNTNITAYVSFKYEVENTRTYRKKWVTTNRNISTINVLIDHL